ncbi:hypothetical protein ZIOFF_007528 [Zingiber officinale]|uniref:Autophagy-related protein n=1 Tax=Zingiber officinale TaxID=94328 RepID=A0A8J5M5V2_ZINOF|nr:hypothetical protein ZIOFF_007528 [Zingiber officinale]
MYNALFIFILHNQFSNGIPRDMSVGQLIHVLSRRRLHLAAGKALFMFVNNTLPQTAAIMDSLHEPYKDEDGFLYMCYSIEKTFG